MALKWKVMLVIVALYSCGMIGVAMHTYTAASAVSNSSPSVETTKVVFIMLGGLGVILPTYLNVWQSLETAKLQEDQVNRSKMENTFRLLEKWDDKTLLEARSFTRQLKEQKDSLSPDELRKRIAENPALKQSVILIFNYFDLLRISIGGDRVHKDVIVDALSEVFHDIKGRFQPWLEREPKPFQDDMAKLAGFFEKRG